MLKCLFLTERDLNENSLFDNLYLNISQSEFGVADDDDVDMIVDQMAQDGLSSGSFRCVLCVQFVF